MSIRWKSWVQLLVVVVVVGGLSLLLAKTMQGPAFPELPDNLNPFPGRAAKCPGHGADAVSDLTLPGNQTNVPEFNDCQRFIINGKYDAIYAVFVKAQGTAGGAMAELKALECAGTAQVMRFPGAQPRQQDTSSSGGSAGGTVTQPGGGTVVGGGGAAGAGGVAGGGVSSVANPQLNAPVMGAATTISTGGGVQVGEVYLAPGTRATTDLNQADPNFTFPGDCRTQANRQVNGVGVPFAIVASWGGTYSRLGIEPLYTCLYFYDSANLKAMMVPVGKDESRCAVPIDPDHVSGTKLPVRVLRRAGLGDTDYPAVARWDRIPSTGHMYIGIACGGAWCEVGVPRWGPMRRMPDGTMAPGPVESSVQRQFSSIDPKARRVVEVKGWYDEQELAVLRKGKPVPSGVIGTLIPDPLLNEYTDATFMDHQWHHAASILLSGDLKKYKDSYNLEATTDFTLAQVNQGYLCVGTLDECIPNQTDRGRLTHCKNTPGTEMFAKIVAVGGSTLFRCVTRTGHPALSTPIPGVVRWAWFDTDEGGWWRCPASCCFPD